MNNSSPRVGIVIQARMNSSRFPNKSMAPIFGSPLIEWVIQSCKTVNNAQLVVLAIPETPECDAMEEIALKLNTPFLRGSRENVLSRYIEAGRLYDLDYIVRITGDDPCHWPPLIELAIDRCLKHGWKYFLSSTDRLRLVDGLIFEIISHPILEALNKFYGHELDTQEHVTTTLRDKKMPVDIMTFEPSDIPAQLLDDGIKLCVDTLTDYQLLLDNWAWTTTKRGRISDTFSILTKIRKKYTQ